jgi:hypothetical protein
MLRERVQRDERSRDFLMFKPSVRFCLIARRNGREGQPRNAFADVSRNDAADGAETGYSNADYCHCGPPFGPAYAGATPPASLTPSSPGPIFSDLGGQEECAKLL